MTVTTPLLLGAPAATGSAPFRSSASAPHSGHRACRRLYAIWERAIRGCGASRRAAPKQKRRPPRPGSGGDQHATRDQCGDEAEHVALQRTVLGFLVLGGEGSDDLGEAAPPVEPAPTALPMSFSVSNSSSLSPLPATKVR